MTFLNKPSLEQQFLPAVLEIQETPPSPIGRALIGVIVLFFVTAFLWACIGHIDIVAVASGKIIPNGHVKVVQPLETGTVTAIHIKEGQQVKKGDRLLEFDLNVINAEIAQLKSEHLFLQKKIKRIKKLLSLANAGSMDKSFQNDPVLYGQLKEYRDRLNALHSEKNKHQAEYNTAQQQVKKLEAILPIINQKSANEKKLVGQNLFPKQQYLETEQQRLTTHFDLKSQHSRGIELEQTLAEIDAQISHAESDFVKTHLESIEEFNHSANKIEQELIKIQTRQKAQILLSPIDGIVQQLSLHTIGGVVTPAQQLMIIVPNSVDLEIEAFVENKDIGFVHEHQKASIKLDAFPFTKYGILDGSIISLSDDAINDEKKGLIFKARVSLEQTTINVAGKQVALSPGMVANVEIKTGQRRIIEFFLSPLLRYSNESIRER